MTIMIDAAVGGTLMNNEEEEAYNAIEKIAANNNQCPLIKFDVDA